MLWLNNMMVTINVKSPVEMESFSHTGFISTFVSCNIDNHSSGYLGTVVQHCVRAYLGPHCILAQKQYCQKLMTQLNSTAFFTPVCVF